MSAPPGDLTFHPLPPSSWLKVAGLLLGLTVLLLGLSLGAAALLGEGAGIGVVSLGGIGLSIGAALLLPGYNQRSRRRRAALLPPVQLRDGTLIIPPLHPGQPAQSFDLQAPLELQTCAWHQTASSATSTPSAWYTGIAVRQGEQRAVLYSAEPVGRSHLQELGFITANAPQLRFEAQGHELELKAVLALWRALSA